MTHVLSAASSSAPNVQYPAPSYMLDVLTPSTSHWRIKTSYFARKSAVKTGLVVMRSTAALLCVLSQSVNAEVLSAPPIPA